MRGVLFSLVLFSFGFSWAKCDEALLNINQVTEKLWQEAIHAEKNLFALRLSAKVLISQVLNEKKVTFNFKDKSGNDIATKINQEKLMELVTSQAEYISDLYHFGVPMELPSLNATGVDSEKLASEVSTEIPAEQIQKFAQQMAMKILALGEEDIPQIFLQVSEMVEKEYKGFFNALRDNQGAEHSDLYAYKHHFIEISNYTSQLRSEAKGHSRGIGFLPKDKSPDPEIKKPIGFIH